MEMKWKLHRYCGFMTESILNKIEQLELAIIKAYGLDHSLATLCYHEEGCGTVITMPIIMTETGIKSISSLVPIQDWRWYSDSLSKFLDFGHLQCIDVVNLNAVTEAKGYEVARVNTTSIEYYLSTRDKSTRKTLRKVYEKEYPQLRWSTATEQHRELLEQLIKDHIAYWSSKDNVDFSEIAEISSKLYSELALGEFGYCRIGFLGDKPVCAYIWVEHDDVWHSVMAMRDREVPLQLGHCMQIDKVLQGIGKGEFCLGRSNDFPHKKKWATSIQYLGAIGEGYK